MGQKEKEWIEVYIATNMVEAQLLKGKFEACDIPVLLKYESAGQLYGITVDGLSEIRLYIPKELEPEANSIMNEFESKGIIGA